MRDPTAPRKKYALAKWIRKWNAEHPDDERITYWRPEGQEKSDFNPDTEVIGQAARETLKKVQRAAKMPHVDGHFDRETMKLLLPPGIRGLVMATAHSQLGVHEWPDGSNSGPVRKYLKAAGYPWAGPWCAAFVTWCLKQNGIESLPPNPAWVPSWIAYGRQHGLLKRVENSQLGDLWVWWGGAHIGFCDDERPEDPVAYGLDGNVGEHGGSVTEVSRSSGEITAVIDLKGLSEL